MSRSSDDPSNDDSVGGTGAVTVDGMRLTYRRAGSEGPPVVLLHGGGVDDASLSWKHAIDALADGYRVYAPNWPGYADSQDGVAHSTETYVDVLAGFLDAVALDEAALVGISMGGGAALGFALDHPERVSKLGLVDSYGLGAEIPVGSAWYAIAHTPFANQLGWSALSLTRGTTRAALQSIVADATTLDPEFVDEFRQRAGRPDAGTAFAAFQRRELDPGGLVRTNYVDRLPSLEPPTLLVHGVRDRLFPARWSRRAHAMIPDSQLVLLDSCGHWAPRERPVAFNEALLEFLDERA